MLKQLLQNLPVNNTVTRKLSPSPSLSFDLCILYTFLRNRQKHLKLSHYRLFSLIYQTKQLFSIQNPRKCTSTASQKPFAKKYVMSLAQSLLVVPSPFSQRNFSHLLPRTISIIDDKVQEGHTKSNLSFFLRWIFITDLFSLLLPFFRSIVTPTIPIVVQSYTFYYESEDKELLGSIGAICIYLWQQDGRTYGFMDKHTSIFILQKLYKCAVQFGQELYSNFQCTRPKQFALVLKIGIQTFKN